MKETGGLPCVSVARRDDEHGAAVDLAHVELVRVAAEDHAAPRRFFRRVRDGAGEDEGPLPYLERLLDVGNKISRVFYAA